MFERLLAALSRLRIRPRHFDSPWERVPMRVPATAFGPGSRRDFSLYFEGESSVNVASIEEIAAWLLGCEYISDPELFDRGDFWQHPSIFEQWRRGDCEDFALWAWRKLAEIGIDAEFYVGRVRCGPRIDRQHAWVVYRHDRTDFLFEPAARDPQQMIRRLAEARDDYVPHFAVNRRFDTCAFAGCMLDSGRPR